MSAITAKASRKMKKYAVLTREPRCFLGSFDFSWEQRKLGDISEIKTGPFGSTLHADDYVSDGIPIITTEHFKTGALPRSKNGLPQVSDADYKRLTSYTLNDGDIVFSRVGSVDINALITPFQSNWLFSGRVLRVRPRTDISSQFLHTRLETESIKSDIRARAVGQTMPSINTEILKITPLVLPTSAAEQEQIGSYFAAIDNLITLHQRKCALLFSSFQALISMMFTTSTFSWEQRKAIDIADYSKGNGYSKGDLTDSGTPIILYGRLYTKYQFAISEVDTFAVPRNGAVYSQGNEVIVPASGETAEDIARASAVEKSGVLLGGDLNILRPFDFINPLFLALAISNGEPQKELAKKAQGKSVVHIHNTDIQEVTIAYPSRTEQDRIVSVFRQLDNLITLHQRKCISFTVRAGRLISTVNKKRITSSWEQRKLGDIADIVGGGTPSTGNQSYWDGDIDWYAPAEIADQIYANSSQKKITGLGYENSSAKMLPPGTVLFTSRAGIGKTAILTRKGCTNQGFQSIVPHRGELDSYFIFSRTEELKRYGELVGAGSTFVEVSGKQMAVMELMMPPTMREQQTIGGFFQQLDHLITLHQRKPFLMKWRTSDANRNQTNRLVL